MIRLFTENRALAIFLLPIFIVGYVLLNYFFPHFETTKDLNLGLFGTYLIPDVLSKQIAGGFIILCNAIGLNIIFNNQNFFEKTTYFPAFIYIVWMSFFNGMYNPDGLLLSHSVCIIMLSQLFRLNQNEDGRKLVFNAAFLVGLATCFHLTMVLLLPFLFFMVWIVRPFVLRESLLLLAGFIVPLLYAAVLILFQGQSIGQSWDINLQVFSDVQLPLFFIGSLIFLFIIISLFGISTKLKKSSIRFRKLIRMLWIFLFLALCLGIIDFLLSRKIDSFSLLFVVLPFFSFFSFVKKPLSIIANSLFFIALICSLLKFFLK
jgi:hypothetical protein